jgi:predicted Zn-dependent protease
MAAGSALLIVGLSACSNVAYTKRTQLNLMSEDDEMKLGAQAFADVKAKSRLSKDPEMNAMLNRVGRRLAAAAEKPNYKWEFILIDDPKTVNAFCLPGGRVAFYTGILPVTKDEVGMAVVMSHEVAHALAHHGAERMSQQKVAGFAENVAVQTGYIKTQGQLQLADKAYGIGLGLPHSRAQESEADHIGLILMAKAGYDPRQAIPFWQRMKGASGGKKPPAFLSTHPSDDARINKIQSEIPEALTYYKPKK